MNLSEQQIQTIKAIVRVFETNKPADGYGVPSRAKGDRGVLSFGVIQYTLSGGSLSQLVQLYCRTAGAKLAERFAPFLDPLEQKSPALRDEPELGAALIEAASDPAMQYAQDYLEHNVYLKTAIREAEKLGAQSALMVAICHDVIVHGWTTEWDKLAGKVNQAHGTLQSLGEIRWIARYLEERAKSLRSAGGLLAKTVYRPQTFANLLQANNLDLRLPFKVHGQQLTDRDLPVFHQAPVDSGDGADDLLFVCKYGIPAIRGENVRQVQLALQGQGYDIGRAGADGDYGNGTCTAVRQFQAAQGLKAHGAVDRATRARLLGAGQSSGAGMPTQQPANPMADYAFRGAGGNPGAPTSISPATDLFPGNDNPGLDAAATWARDEGRPVRPPTAQRQINDLGLDIILKYHIASPTPYRVADQRFAIGFGHKTNVDPDLRIGRAEAYEFLYEDLDQVERIVESAVGMDLTDNEFSALVSFAFDLEPKRFRLSPVVQQLRYGGVAHALIELKKFTRYGGDMDQTLMRRRTEEATLFLTPDHQVPLSAEHHLIAETPEHRKEVLSGLTRRNKKKEKTLVKSRTMVGAGAGVTGASGLILGDPDSVVPPAAETGATEDVAKETGEGLMGLLEQARAWAMDLDFSWGAFEAWLSQPMTRMFIGLLITVSVALILYARYDDWKNERR